LESREGRNVAVESRSGFILQHNVHVEVPSEARAQAVIASALESGFGDVVAVDHFCNRLEAARHEAQKKALEEARRKAGVFLEPLFGSAPPLINVHEKTTVIHPKDQYASFESAYVSRFQNARHDRSVPTIAAVRPKNTYLEGLIGAADVGPAILPMKPEISVVSTVKLYFASPAADRASETKKPR
jgi:hypothetical protein